jgi:hypothetical protein
VVEIDGYQLTEMGYFSHGSWQIDIVASTKQEAIWLTRCCQYFICRAQMDLARLGVTEIGISLADVRIEQELQPSIAFARGLTMTARVANTWYEEHSSTQRATTTGSRKHAHTVPHS